MTLNVALAGAGAFGIKHLDAMTRCYGGSKISWGSGSAGERLRTGSPWTET